MLKILKIIIAKGVVNDEDFEYVEDPEDVYYIKHVENV